MRTIFSGQTYNYIFVNENANNKKKLFAEGEQNEQKICLRI